MTAQETRRQHRQLTAERRSVNNKISGCRTQLKRARTDARRAQLERYHEHLLRRRDDLPLEIEILEREEVYNEVVDTLAAPSGLFKVDTARRNAQAGRRRRRGLEPLETISSELRRDAERKIARLLEERADDPTVARLAAQLDRADQLRAELARRQEERNPWLADEATA